MSEIEKAYKILIDDVESIINYAKKRGLETKWFKACLEDYENSKKEMDKIIIGKRTQK
jgi:hypothetical protein